MRVGYILAGLAALFSTTAGAPGYSGGLGFCFDDFDCILQGGGKCVKTNGFFVGKCSGGHSTTKPGNPTITGSPIPTGSGAPRHPRDIGDIAARVATRTDLPAEITAFAKSIANRPEFASHGSGSMTHSVWKPSKTQGPPGEWKTW